MANYLLSFWNDESLLTKAILFVSLCILISTIGLGYISNKIYEADRNAHYLLDTTGLFLAEHDALNIRAELAAIKGTEVKSTFIRETLESYLRMVGVIKDEQWLQEHSKSLESYAAVVSPNSVTDAWNWVIENIKDSDKLQIWYNRIFWYFLIPTQLLDFLLTIRLFALKNRPRNMS